MTVLIDGYNLIYASDRWSSLMDTDRIEEARDDMVDCVARAFASRKEQVIIIFDGKPGITQSRLRDYRPRGPVRVVFSNNRGTADDRIIGMVRQAEEPLRMTIITSDRRIREAVRECGAQVVTSRDFRIQVFERLKQARAADNSDPLPPISYYEYMEMLREHEKEED